MSYALVTFISLIIRAGTILMVANEIRGLILAGPVLYGMYLAGGTLMAIWIGFCSLAGIALSVVVPLFVARKAHLALAPLRNS
jgi:hypothetical protein